MENYIPHILEVCLEKCMLLKQISLKNEIQIVVVVEVAHVAVVADVADEVDVTVVL